MILAIATGCKGTSEKEPVKAPILPIQKPRFETLSHCLPDRKVPIDYKTNQYHFFLGQSIDSVRTKIWVQRNHDEDYEVDDDTGVLHYMSLSEPNIVIHNGYEVAPAIYWTTNRGRVIAFDAAIIFDRTNEDGLHHFLKSISFYYLQLKPEKNKQALMSRNRLVMDSSAFKEVFL